MSQITLTLPDGNQRHYDAGITAGEVATDIATSLGKKAISATVNDTHWDLQWPITCDSSIAINTMKDSAPALELVRHDLAHIMARAVQEIWTDVKVTIGPVIKDGWYYDFDRAEPFTPEDLGVIEKKMKEIINDLELPKTMGLIVRTAGANKTKNEIKDDLTNLLGTWEEIRMNTLKSIAPSAIYEEEDLIARAIRDFYSKDIDSIIVDGDKAFEAAKKYAKKISSAHVKNVIKYKGKIPIFHHYNIEKYLNSIFEPRIELKSGGYIILSPTEALVSIDINSGRSTRERNVEKTALTNNLEAAEEIARQVKLRDLAGLIVIDFIDMENYSNKRLVERKLRESLKNDKARIQFGRISNFGLLEMTRQRLRESSIKWEIQLSVDSFALKILKLLEERAFSDEKIKIIDVSLSKKIIDILNNTYSTELKFFKDKYKFKINLVQNAEFLSQEFLFSFYDVKKKLISEFNGTEVKEDTSVKEKPELKEKAENFAKEDVKENSEKKEESIDPKKRESYKTKRKKFFNKNRFKDNKKPKKKEASPSKEIS